MKRMIVVLIAALLCGCASMMPVKATDADRRHQVLAEYDDVYSALMLTCAELNLEITVADRETGIINAEIEIGGALTQVLVQSRMYYKYKATVVDGGSFQRVNLKIVADMETTNPTEADQFVYIPFWEAFDRNLAEIRDS